MPLNSLPTQVGLIGHHRYLLSEDYFSTIDVFEQQDSFGGVWNYSSDPRGTVDIPQTNPNQPLEEPIWRSSGGLQNGDVDGEDKKKATFISPIYERLESNIPHVLMKHSDKLLEDNQLFPSRETVVKYLEEYAEDIKHLVHFQTQVTDVSRICEGSQDAWLVQVRDLVTGKVSEAFCDAVVVANGHYTVPTLPDIKGIREWNAANPGIMGHSKFYRRPDGYRDKKVIIVGNAASGTDIATQIATVCKYPLLLSSRSESVLFPFSASYKENVPEIVEFLPLCPGQVERAVRFKDGRVEEGIDAIIFATGYYYSFPFLESLKPAVITTGERVEGLYQHIFYIHEPTLAFIGLPPKIIPFRTFEGQAAVIARVWSNKLDLPSVQEMMKWEESVIKERGLGKGFHVLPFPKDFEYHNEMVEWAERARDSGDGKGKGKLPPKWNEKETWTRERFPAIKRAFAEKGEGRHGVRTVEELGFDYEGWLRGERGEGKRESAG